MSNEKQMHTGIFDGLAELAEQVKQVKGDSTAAAKDLLETWLLSQRGQHMGFITALVLCNEHPEYAHALYKALPEDYQRIASEAVSIMVNFQGISQ